MLYFFKKRNEKQLKYLLLQQFKTTTLTIYN